MSTPLFIVTGNIDEVLSELDKVVHAAKKCGVAALDPRHWKQRAKAMASQALFAVAEPEHRRFIDDVIDSFSVDLVGTRAMELRAHYRESSSLGVEKGLVFEDQIGSFDPVFRNELMQTILSWVESGTKNKDGRDKHADGTDKSDPEIAEGIYWALFHPNETSFGRDLARESFLNSTNPTGLLAYARSLESAGLPRDVLLGWYDVIWDSWVAMLEIELPERMRSEFRRLRAA